MNNAQNLPMQQGVLIFKLYNKSAPDDFAELQFSIASDCCTFDSQQNIYYLLNMIKNDDVKETDLKSALLPFITKTS